MWRFAGGFEIAARKTKLVPPVGTKEEMKCPVPIREALVAWPCGLLANKAGFQIVVPPVICPTCIWYVFDGTLKKFNRATLGTPESVMEI